MTFLLRPLLTTSVVLAALLLWWRPAPVLMEVQPVDWAKAYEEAHSPIEQPIGIKGFYREITRSSKPHQPLTEFIAGETEGQLIRANGEDWLNWHAAHFPQHAGRLPGALYFSPDVPPFSGLTQQRGYIEIHNQDNVDFLFFNTVPARYFHDLKIPADRRYPFRKEAVAMFSAAIALMLFNRFRRREPDVTGDSSAGRGCKVFAAILACGVALLGLPFFYHDVEGNIPFVVIGFFGMIAGFIGLGMFGWQVHILRQLLDGKDLLAHWTYGPEEWQRFVQWEFKEEREEKHGLWLFVSAIIVVVGLGFWLAMRDQAAAWVFLVLLGLIPLLWIVAVLLPRLTYRRNIRGPGAVYIGTSGMVVNGSVHTWRLLGARFESAEYRNEPFPLLAVLYSYLMMAGRSLFVFRQYAEVRAPVPAGREEEAKRIAETLRSKGPKRAEPETRTSKTSADSERR